MPHDIALHKKRCYAVLGLEADANQLLKRLQSGR